MKLYIAENVIFVKVETHNVMYLQMKELQLKEENVKRCVVENNQGEVLNYKPNTKIQFQDKIIIADDVCSIRMYNINNTYAGIWKITTYSVPKQDQNKTDEDETMISYDGGVISREEVFHVHTVQVNLVSL